MSDDEMRSDPTEENLLRSFEIFVAKNLREIETANGRKLRPKKRNKLIKELAKQRLQEYLEKPGSHQEIENEDEYS